MLFYNVFFFLSFIILFLILIILWYCRFTVNPWCLVGTKSTKINFTWEAREWNVKNDKWKYGVIEFLNLKDIKTNIWGQKNRKDVTSSRRPKFITHLNFLFVFLSSAETCQRILSPLCHGSSSSTSNSPSCKSPSLVWSVSCWLLFVFHNSNLSLCSVNYLPQHQLSSLHYIIIPGFVVQNLSFVWAHVQDRTYRQFGSPVIVQVICWLN